MPTAHKVLGQLNPAAGALSTLYTVPGSTEAVVSTLMICNLSISGSVRVAVRPAGAAIDNKHYQVYDRDIDSKDSLPLTIGMTLAATDVVSVYGSHNMFSFSLFGAEITP